MNTPYRTLLERIRKEMEFVNYSVDRSEKAWQKALKNNDESYYDSVALNIHNMYNGIERIFEIIATSIDESIPEGKNWHRDLLIQMSLAITDIRPNVISQQLFVLLDEYRSFRHIVRNIYAFQYDKDRLQKLVNQLHDCMLKLNNEIEIFSLFLQQS